MWALTLLTVLQAARANSCVRITIGTDESGAKTVSKSFAITARSPEACKKNQFSGLGPTKAYSDAAHSRRVRMDARRREPLR